MVKINNKHTYKYLAYTERLGYEQNDNKINYTCGPYKITLSG